MQSKNFSIEAHLENFHQLPGALVGEGVSPEYEPSIQTGYTLLRFVSSLKSHYSLLEGWTICHIPS